MAAITYGTKKRVLGLLCSHVTKDCTFHHFHSTPDLLSGSHYICKRCRCTLTLSVQAGEQGCNHFYSVHSSDAALNVQCTGCSLRLIATYTSALIPEALLSGLYRNKTMQTHAQICYMLKIYLRDILTMEGKCINVKNVSFVKCMGTDADALDFFYFLGFTLLDNKVSPYVRCLG